MAKLPTSGARPPSPCAGVVRPSCRNCALPPGLLARPFVEQFLTCGKAACPCHQGHKHGPYYYLTLCVAAGKIRKFLLKTPEQQQQAQAGTAAYRQFYGTARGTLANQRRSAASR